MGGTGPKAVTPLGGGRRVGGDTTGRLVLSDGWRLCDLDWEGGGPGGGGGRGIPGSHLTCDAERDRADVGVSMAPTEAALLEFGGAALGPAVEILGGSGWGIWIERCRAVVRVANDGSGGFWPAF